MSKCSRTAANLPPHGGMEPNKINPLKEYAAFTNELASEATDLCGELEQLATERVATVAALRDLCNELGDNDWPDSLPLAEVIQKHLVSYIFEE